MSAEKSYRLFVLDVSPVPSGSSSTDALRNTLELAQLADKLGYTRYWLAEHHNTPLIASSTPEVMIGHVADVTKRIRVGSGGMMLPNHTPLKVAETFRVLEALHPGRVDLGIGRAPGLPRLRSGQVAAAATKATPSRFIAARGGSVSGYGVNRAQTVDATPDSNFGRHQRASDADAHPENQEPGREPLDLLRS
jgi:luciferase family oxidoreductase group 1